MEPGERLSLIQSIYAKLLEPGWEWQMVDAALSEFGADEVHIADPATRTLRRIRLLSDENLSALGAYLDQDSADPSAAVRSSEEGPWQPDHFRLFVSHTSAHKDLAGQLRESMLNVRIDSFVAHTTIEPTREWVEEIEKALRTCDALVALITPDFIESRWCDQEVGVSYGIGTLVVPIRVGLDPYGFIGRFQAATFDPSQHIYVLRARLFDLLAGHPQTQARMVDPVITRFADSPSFDGTRAAWPSMKQLPREAWTDKRLAQVREAARNNGQVREAGINDGEWHPAPDLIERHFASLGIDPPKRPPSDDDIPF